MTDLYPYGTQKRKSPSRSTPQKALISRLFHSHKHPISLKKLYESVIAEDPQIAYTTVFRWITKMKADGLASTVEVRNQSARYEPVGLRSNVYIYCKQCDEIFRINDASTLLQGINLGGAIVEDYQITLYGMCEYCARKV